MKPNKSQRTDAKATPHENVVKFVRSINSATEKLFFTSRASNLNIL